MWVLCSYWWKARSAGRLHLTFQSHCGGAALEEVCASLGKPGKPGGRLAEKMEAFTWCLAVSENWSHLGFLHRQTVIGRGRMALS